MSDRNQVEEIKRKLDIVTVVREFVPTLKKTGRNYFGLCPFHSERSPSFSVNEELQIYKCFGCGESGDVITFLEKIEGIDFPKALELAAKRAGVELVRTFSPEQKKRMQEKEKVLAANKLTAQFYHYILMKHKNGEACREYVKGRKLRKAELEKFQIGFAPEGFENLKGFLVKKGYSTEQLVKWGLLVEKNGRRYDKFRARLMFPIFNVVGDIVGFSGRVIKQDDLGPKYLNSPETPVYRKSELVYGLYQGKDEVRKQGFAIIVEGNVDILSSHSVGVENIVAPLGTALTEEQLKLIKRYADEVYFSFDSDEAGEKALIRALELAEKAGVKFKAIDLQGFQDADELITNGGDWKKTVAASQPLIMHLMNRMANEYDLNSASGKDQYAKKILGFIDKLTSNIEKAHYLERLSETVKVDQNELKKELGKISRTETPVTPESKDEMRHSLSGVKFLLAFLLAHGKFAARIKAEDFAEVVTDPVYLKLLRIALGDEKLLSELGESEKELYTELKLTNIELVPESALFLKEVGKQINRLEREKIKIEITKLRFDSDADKPTRLRELTRKLVKLE
jgi:DNA primase